ncbi:MAG: sugar-binding domain-containing protein [Chloroflexota bacterium]
MDHQPPIHLNENWLYLFVENQRSNFSALDLDESMWIPLPLLSDWAVSSSVQSGADWFRRTFKLDDVNRQMNYRLIIDKVPETVRVFVNGELAGEAGGGQAFESDVSRVLREGTNVIAVQLICTSDRGGGVFGEVHIRSLRQR